MGATKRAAVARRKDDRVKGWAALHALSGRTGRLVDAVLEFQRSPGFEAITADDPEAAELVQLLGEALAFFSCGAGSKSHRVTREQRLAVCRVAQIALKEHERDVAEAIGEIERDAAELEAGRR